MSTQVAAQELVNDLVGNAHGNLARVKEILSEHPELVNAKAVWGETPVEAAAQVGNKGITEYLLNLGAPLDICTAVMLGMLDTVRVYLIDDPKQAHARGAHGIPVLYFAILHDEQGIAEFLLKQGADVNEGEGTMTPLHGAALFNKPDMATWLLKKHARGDVKDSNGKTPLQVAEENKHEAVAQVLRACST